MNLPDITTLTMFNVPHTGRARIRVRQSESDFMAIARKTCLKPMCALMCIDHVFESDFMDVMREFVQNQRGP